MAGKLETYNQKRRFNETPEPAGEAARKRAARTRGTASAPSLSFVIQEHHARRLHYDFRLELDGTLKSWAIPKGPSLDPLVKRLAVHVEDHPIEYGSFEGEIPPGNYGAGSVIVWDRGSWRLATEENALAAYQAGKLKFRLDGEKLHGGWTLVRSHMRGSGDKEQWLLIKERDEEARNEAEFNVLEKRPGSVLDAAPKPARQKAAATKTAKKAAKTAHQDRETASARSERVLTRSHATLPSTRGKNSRPDIVSTRSTGSLRELASHPAIKGAVKATLPSTFKPQLATLVDTAPSSGDDWSYEIKFDGYRVLVRIETRQGEPHARIFTRAGNDWTEKFGRLATAFTELGIESGWLDGEAVVLDDDGLPDFQALQNAFDIARPQDIVIYLFDVPFLNGYDLRDVPLVQRRAILRALLEDTEPLHLRFSEDFPFSADELLRSACAMSLEGIIGKRLDSGYASRRSSSWIKLKCRRRQEFVIGGYTEPSGSRTQFGALLLGVHDSHGKLQYAGRVGSGFTASTLRAVHQQLERHVSDTMPFAKAPSERSRTPVHWVEPKLVAECNFAEWTDERIVRQASFVSLRNDKPAKQIVREAPVKGATVQNSSAHEAAPARAKTPSASAPSKTVSKSTEKAPVTRSTLTSTTESAPKSAIKSRSNTSDNTIAGVRITHPDRVIDKQSQARKIDLARYYESVAQRMLIELKDRPLALVRAPDDIGGELFFQKHSQRLAIPGVTQHPGLDPGHSALMTLDTVKAVVGAAQMGTVEMHTWNALASAIEKPDRMVFDLDPDPVLGWDRMIEAAQLTRTLLEELGLSAFCKTSGGKGLHVVVPLAKQAGWDEVKAFTQGVAQHMAATLPDHFSAKMGAQNRRKKIFIDYLRNNRGSTTVAAFSARARPGLGVSVPIAWDELPQTTAGDQWNITNVHERLDSLEADPWAAYPKSRQRLTAAMKKRLDLDKGR
ncbi:DNA ligase D [Pararobbsia alpina]|uniref:DNA ligase (ATP) n=1 Tax=Pararobbsia alpina TaxID=621374 RepID=A0A6S7BQU1_9BURK|nr:DNA ligase D [Pararobbsia alpina]CAB3792362.1 DNA ligase [Pararobbsia alpina]